jgi:hypothetical protein
MMGGGGKLVGSTRLGFVVLTAVSMVWLTGAAGQVDRLHT